MELLTSLPAELVAIADPMARGPAPLLRPAEANADAAVPPAPFDVCLALLAMPSPAGEAWPAAGNALPAAPFDPAAATTAGSAALADAHSTTAADAVLLARLRPAASRPLALLPAMAGAAQPLPGAEPPSAAPAGFLADAPEAGAFVVGTAANVDLAAAQASPVAEAVPLDALELQAQAASAEPSELPAPFETDLPYGEHASRPAATASGESRQAAAPFPPGAAAAAAPQPQPAAEAAVIAANGLRRDGAPKISPPPGVPPLDAPSLSRPEWLPPQLGHATSAAPSAPGPPVDVRTPGWQETFANRVQWLVDSNVDEARITLHPPELGAVDVEISLVDDKTYVQLTTSTAAARDELSQSLPRLRELFTVSGLELGGASVHDGRDGQRAGHGNGASSAAPRSLAPLAELADEPPLRALPSRPLGRIDVFA